VLLAGSRPGGDPFARAHGVATKAEIAVAGVPMVTRVAETLLASGSVARIVVLAQEPDALRPLLPPSVADRRRPLRRNHRRDAAPICGPRLGAVAAVRHHRRPRAADG
jgi:hypothetical protein